jgi:hypothetical protein
VSVGEGKEPWQGLLACAVEIQLGCGQALAILDDIARADVRLWWF